MRRFVLIAVPYLWLLALFLVPFLIVLKISLSDVALARPPYMPQLDLTQGLDGLLAFFSDLLRSSSAGQPLVGEGAPPAFARAFTASAQSPVARSAAWLLESVRLRGARRTALTLAGASTMLLAAAVSVGIAVARLK